jgi:hypothetical protein
MNVNLNYYTILNLAENADPAHIKSGYRQLAKLYHPDRNPGNAAAEEKMKLINEAYEVLSDPVQRLVYDQLRKEKNQTASESDEQQSVKQPAGPTTRTYEVEKLVKVYFKGKVELKFFGTPEWADPYILLRAQQYQLKVTELELTIASDNIWMSPPSSYWEAYNLAIPLKLSLPVIIRTTVLNGDVATEYDLAPKEIRVEAANLADITKHDQNTFGTFKATAYGNFESIILVTETVDDLPKEHATGEVEVKVEGSDVYYRTAFRQPGGAVYWQAWRNFGYTLNNKTAIKGSSYPNTNIASSGDQWGCITVLSILFLCLAALHPSFLVAFAIVAGYLLIYLVSNLLRRYPLLFLLIVGVFLIFGLSVNSSHSGIEKERNPAVDNGFKASSKIVTNTSSSDSVLKKIYEWSDPEDREYYLEVVFPFQTIEISREFLRQLSPPIPQTSPFQIVYKELVEHDEKALIPIARSLHTLAKSKQLTPLQEATMVVSLVQSMPYALVLEQSCQHPPRSEAVVNFLRNCNSGCCISPKKFGILSPIDMFATARGDCDSKALLLYLLLKQMDYNVAVFTSIHYQHAVLAINVEVPKSQQSTVLWINNKPYWFWETTSYGSIPGKMPLSYSDIQYWQSSIYSTKKITKNE